MSLLVFCICCVSDGPVPTHNNHSNRPTFFAGTYRVSCEEMLRCCDAIRSRPTVQVMELWLRPAIQFLQSIGVLQLKNKTNGISSILLGEIDVVVVSMSTSTKKREKAGKCKRSSQRHHRSICAGCRCRCLVLFATSEYVRTCFPRRRGSAAVLLLHPKKVGRIFSEMLTVSIFAGQRARYSEFTNRPKTCLWRENGRERER